MMEELEIVAIKAILTQLADYVEDHIISCDGMVNKDIMLDGLVTALRELSGEND